jgi:hypothetical protein
MLRKQGVSNSKAANEKKYNVGWGGVEWGGVKKSSQKVFVRSFQPQDAILKV